MLLATHYLFEAEELCDELAFIGGGRLLAKGLPAQLRALAEDVHVLECEVTGLIPSHQDLLVKIDGVIGISVHELGGRQLLTVQCREPERIRGFLASELTALSIGRSWVRNPTLEDAYVKVVKQAGRVSDAG